MSSIDSKEPEHLTAGQPAAGQQPAPVASPQPPDTAPRRSGASRVADRLAWARLPRAAGNRALDGNQVELLRGGGDFFPALIDAIDGAQLSVSIETYIYEDDTVGRAVADAMMRAAARGVSVRLLLDGFGADGCPAELKERLLNGGVKVRIYRPLRRFRPGRSQLRRLHRKLAVIDREIAFVGGINIIDDHNHGPFDEAQLGPRYDFAVRVTGPVAGQVALTAERLWWRVALRAEPRGLAALAAEFPQPRQAAAVPPDPPGEAPAGLANRGGSNGGSTRGVRAALLLRDNLRNRRTIERAYLQALGAARRDVIIANAYFLPGHKMRRALLACRRRGVRVRLLLQGMVEYKLQHYATHALYATLLEAGVEIHEYNESFLHAKVAVVDDSWATVGSSNMDPFSLLLAREANVAVYDAGFAARLRHELERAIALRSRQVVAEAHARRGALRRFGDWAAYLLLRFGVMVAGAAGRY
ncbi:cardiolipin synthase ClsB [Cupriavidus sp. AU9028]|uniref:cardiolipin synthase ClsB n=1 Tax=Cupriavidus sp. AU9028 TaxID=2871157 RepID=UPI001C96857D|nr:cardiolipin synthase ClsB [Cupriavidus sp. AU9028]MBY4898963.1 cardiolipin synthase ClsB [Cupriavidus sp. AU9028]